MLTAASNNPPKSTIARVSPMPAYGMKSPKYIPASPLVHAATTATRPDHR